MLAQEKAISSTKRARSSDSDEDETADYGMLSAHKRARHRTRSRASESTFPLTRAVGCYFSYGRQARSRAGHCRAGNGVWKNTDTDGRSGAERCWDNDIDLTDGNASEKYAP